MSRFLCQNHAWTLFHFCLFEAFIRQFCHDSYEWCTPGEINHQRNEAPHQEKLISWQMGFESRNCNWKNWKQSASKTWKEEDKQHSIFLHSHCELCQDNKDQLESSEGFMAEHNWQAFSVSSCSDGQCSHKFSEMPVIDLQTWKFLLYNNQVNINPFYEVFSWEYILV